MNKICRNMSKISIWVEFLDRAQNTVWNCTEFITALMKLDEAIIFNPIRSSRSCQISISENIWELLGRKTVEGNHASLEFDNRPEMILRSK